MSAQPASRRYELSEEIARGGQGIVLAARDTLLNRDVAVKILKEGYSPESGAARRFVNEARITAQLQHPGIPPIHDLGRLPDGRPFLAMKLIKGRTLADVVADRGHASPNLIPVFEQVCQAVGYAHDRNVIHRDIKPGNVMVGAFGEVQVMDWGLAKILGKPSQLEPSSSADDATSPLTEIDPLREPGDRTLPGSSLGTPAYMSPEQAIGAIDQIDARSDVFGLGAVLCVILTGEPPYRGKSSESCRQQAARAQLGDAFARLDACKGDPKLVELCKRCLSPEKTDRPANAGEVAGEVAQLRTAADERVRRAEVERVRTAARARLRLLAVCAGVGILVAGGAFSWWQDRQAAAKRDADREQRFKEERAALEKKERDGRNAEAVAALLGQCEDALRADDAIRAGIAFGAAEKRMPEGGTDHLKERFDRCRTDLTLLRELDRIDNLRWTVVNGKRTRDDRLPLEWQQVFARWGVELGRTTPEVAARRINESPLRLRILQSLDLWLIISWPPEVHNLLEALDPDFYRSAVRTAGLKVDAKLWQRLIQQPEMLKQPVWFILAQSHFLDPTKSEQPEYRVRARILREAYRREPGNFVVLLSLAEMYQVSEPEGAAERIAWYRAALAVRPSSVIALVNLAVALETLDHYDLAQDTIEKAIELEPTMAGPRVILGNILGNKREWPKAEASYAEAIRLDPLNPDIHSSLGFAMYQKRDWKKCEVAMLESIRLNDKDPEPNFVLGNALGSQMKYDEALVYFQKAVNLDPSNPDYKRQLELTKKRIAERDAKKP